MVISRRVFIHLGLSHDGVFTPRAAAYHISCVDTEITMWTRITKPGLILGGMLGIKEFGESKRSAFLYLSGFKCRSEGGQRSVNIASVNKLPKNPSEQVCVFVPKC